MRMQPLHWVQAHQEDLEPAERVGQEFGGHVQGVRVGGGAGGPGAAVVTRMGGAGVLKAPDQLQADLVHFQSLVVDELGRDVGHLLVLLMRRPAIGIVPDPTGHLGVEGAALPDIDATTAVMMMTKRLMWMRGMGILGLLLR